MRDILRKGERDRFFPATLRFEDELDYLAGRAFAAAALSDVGTHGLQLWRAVRDADPESGAPGEINVGEVVAHVGDLLFSDANATHAVLEGGGLVSLAEADKVHLHLLGALRHGRRPAASDKAGLDAHGVGERKPLTILRAERLHLGHDGFRPRLGAKRRDQRDTAVRQRPVDIHQEELDPASPGQYVLRDCLR